MALGGVEVYGYACVPPTPFGLKDWERYDVSRYVDPGCVPPEEGVHTTEVDRRRIRHQTIRADLAALAEGRELAGAVLLCHAPPHGTVLDRADLDGQMIDHAPLDVHQRHHSTRLSKNLGDSASHRPSPNNKHSSIHGFPLLWPGSGSLPNAESVV